MQWPEFSLSRSQFQITAQPPETAVYFLAPAENISLIPRRAALFCHKKIAPRNRHPKISLEMQGRKRHTGSSYSEIQHLPGLRTDTTHEEHDLKVTAQRQTVSPSQQHQLVLSEFFLKHPGHWAAEKMNKTLCLYLRGSAYKLIYLGQARKFWTYSCEKLLHSPREIKQITQGVRVAYCKQKYLALVSHASKD